MSWKEIAWNGVRFSVPAAWEVTQIGPKYLVIGAQEEPAMEIKWERGKGSFSHRTALRRLRTHHGDTVRENMLPEGWKQVLSDFTVTGFTWQAAAMGGRGAILHCPACGNATLIQFFRNHRDPTNQTCLRVLASFRDHSSDDQVLWSIFDIRASIPAAFRLIRHRFEAGTFELNFGSQGQQITLYRWGPASVLLGDGGLLQFAATTVRIHQTELHPLTWVGHDAVQWEHSLASGRWARWWGRMMGEPSFQWFRLWHLAEKNRILSVVAKGKKPIHSHLLDRVCAQYDSI